MNSWLLFISTGCQHFQGQVGCGVPQQRTVWRCVYAKHSNDQDAIKDERVVFPSMGVPTIPQVYRRQVRYPFLSRTCGEGTRTRVYPPQLGMLRLGGLLHDFDVQPIEAFRCDNGFDFVLVIQVWQICIFQFDFVPILSKNVVSQMTEVCVCIGNPCGCWHRSRFPTSSHNMVLTEVGQDQSKLILSDIRHIAQHLYLNISSFWCP